MELTMTNNQYMEFLKANASKVWTDKNYTMKDYDRDAESVKILPFEINTNNETVKEFINRYCQTEEQREGNTLYRGRRDIDEVYSVFSTLNMIQIKDNGYGGSYYNDELLLLVGYAEGDLDFTVCENKESYNKEKNRVIEFYKENY